jgi:hypothetical protein
MHALRQQQPQPTSDYAAVCGLKQHAAIRLASLHWFFILLSRLRRLYPASVSAAVDCLQAVTNFYAESLAAAPREAAFKLEQVAGAASSTVTVVWWVEFRLLQQQ